MGRSASPVLTGDFAHLGEVLAAAAASHGDREAYVDGDERISYATWVARARAVSALLVDHGVRPGDVVALMLPSGIDYAVCYAAAAWAGAITTGLNTRLGQREVTAILEKAKPRLVIRDDTAGLAQAPRQFSVIERARLHGLPPGGSERPATRQADDPATIVWTSGTTGLPKGAWFDHRNLAAAARTAGVMSAPYDRKLVATPFAHAGYMAKLWDQIVWGTTVIVSPTPWTAAEMARLLREEQVSVAGGVPTQWAKLLDEPSMTAHGRLDHIRVGISATAPAAPELVREVATLLGVPLVVRYAMTESPSICGTGVDDPPEVQASTVGRPQEGMRIRIVDEQGLAAPDGTVGRVTVKGPVVMRGYWDEPELTAQTLDSDGWLRSGDLGLITPDGNLRLVGRSGDMYIRGGYNVYPLEVENVLAEHPQVARVAVLGEQAPVIGEIGVAAVVPSDPGDPPSLESLRDWVRGRLADYKAPDRLAIVDDLPLTSMLKVDRVALGQLLTRRG